MPILSGRPLCGLTLSASLSPTPRSIPLLCQPSASRRVFIGWFSRSFSTQNAAQEIELRFSFFRLFFLPERVDAFIQFIFFPFKLLSFRLCLRPFPHNR